jgi:hypothetical protein
LSVGCCQGGEACVLPERDPFVDYGRVNIIDDTVCGYSYSVMFPYLANYQAIQTKVFRNDVVSFDGPACIQPFSAIQRYTWRARRGPAVGNIVNNTCVNIGLPSNRVTTRVGNKIIIDFVDAASYNMAENFFSGTIAEILAEEALTGKNLSGFGFFRPQDVLCGDDGTFRNSASVWHHADIYLTDPVGGVFGAGQICFDYDLPFNRGNFNADPCLNDLWDPADGDESDYLATQTFSAFTYTNATYNGLAAARRYRRNYGNIYSNYGGSPDTTSDPDWHYWSYEMGFTVSSCANSNPVQPYTLRISTLDNYEEWELLRGDIASNLISPDVILSTLDNPDIKRTVLGEAASQTDYAIKNSVDNGSDFIYNNIYLKNESGVTITKNIDFPNLSFDLTFYGGGSTELFADWSALANRISALTGITSTAIPEIGLIGMDFNNFSGWERILASPI